MRDAPTVRLDTLGASPYAYRIVADDGRDVLVQTDYDYPGVASSFGWDIRAVQVQGRGYYGLRPCDHGGTDGTIACEACGLPASVFIDAARAWLDDHHGASVPDPGYFGEG